MKYEVATFIYSLGTFSVTKLPPVNDEGHSSSFRPAERPFWDASRTSGPPPSLCEARQAAMSPQCALSVSRHPAPKPARGLLCCLFYGSVTPPGLSVCSLLLHQ